MPGDISTLLSSVKACNQKEMKMNLQTNTTSFAFQMGLEITGMADGVSDGVLRVDRHHQNSVGLVHGGVLCTISDTLCGAAVISGIDKNRHPLTMDLNVSFLKAARGDRIVGSAKIVHLGRRTAKVECSLFSDDVLIARAYASFILVEKENGTVAGGPSLVSGR